MRTIILTEETAMKINLELTLAHINLRREKEGEEEGPTAADLKLTGDLPIEQLEGLFSTKASFENLLARMFRSDGELVSGDLGSLRLTKEGENLTAEVRSIFEKQGQQFEGAALNKITLTPKSGRHAEVTLRLQVKPSSKQLGRLGESLHHVMVVRTEPRQGELPVDEAA